MKKKEIKKEEIFEEDVPLATMILRDYKQTVQDYKNYNKRLTDSNKRMFVIIIILIILLAIACTYIVLTWDICSPNVGIFRNTC